MCDDRFRSHRRDFGPGYYRDQYRENREHFDGHYRGDYNHDIYRPSNMIAPFPRRFVSNAEFLEFLRSYLKDLEQETQAVKEAIAELEEVIAGKNTKTEEPDSTQ